MKQIKLNRKKKLTLFIAANLVAAACIPLFFIYREIAAAHSDVFGCHFLRVTGLYCPGCGATRALAALLSARPLTALRANPGLVSAFFLALWLDLRLGLAAAERLRFSFGRLERIWSISTATLLIVWAIVRNILLLAFGYDILGGIS